MLKNGISASGAFNTPLSSSSPGPLFPAGKYQFSFEAEEGAKLIFATMFVQSNDIFASPGTGGLPLFDGQGNAVSGDITSQIYFWDAGTETNEEPGIGVN